jgi:hypothetical protein
LIRRTLLLLLLIVFLIPKGVSAQKQNVYERFQPLEVPLTLTTAAKNPYSAEQVDVTIHLSSPSGRSVVIPAFYIVPYRNDCTQNCAAESLRPDGAAGWRFRFTPDESGEWKYIVRVQDSLGTTDNLTGQFEVLDSKRPGFIRVATNNRYFEYTDGTPYFPVGANLGWSWSGGGGTPGYVRWLEQLKRVGANYGRLVIDVPWFIDLEAKAPIGDYTNAQQDAWRLDTILKAAEENGIALQIVLLWSNSLIGYIYPPLLLPATPLRPDMRSDWNQNPYNAVLGGPVAQPALFFSNETARKLFKQRLRYVMARWAYSPAVFSWEVIDQLDRTSATNGAMSDWLREMATTIRAYDPAHHPITAGIKDVSRISLLDPAKLDFRITRQYQRRPIDSASDQVVATLNALKTVSSDKQPILLTDFSLNPWFEPTADDPNGVHVIETMWATALSGASGAAMSNYWDTYLFPQQIVDNFAALAAFSRDVAWNTANLTPVESILQSDDLTLFRPLTITGFNPTLGAKKAPDVTYQVGQEEITPKVDQASAFLYPPRSTFRQPHKYHLTVPTDTILTINTKRMGLEKQAGKLNVALDNRVVAELTINPRAEPISLSLPLSVGEHILTLDNTGTDTLQLDSIQIAAYVPLLRSVSLADREKGIYLGWFQHRDYTFQTVAAKTDPKPAAFQLNVNGMPPGTYRVEFWDLQSGNIAGDETVTVTGSGQLSVQLLPVSKMLAVRAFRMP